MTVTDAATRHIGRRPLLKLAAGAATLGSPGVLRAERDQPLKFVPMNALTLLDPIMADTPFTRSHGYMVFDTLYGVDETFTAQPQMVEGHATENGATIWLLTLREGLRFHDGTPVLARDAVASIRRWAVHDGFCQKLMEATAELTSPNDRTIRFRLNQPFPNLPQALAGLGPHMPAVLPERLASTDPHRPVVDMIGSGPYRFVAADFVIGEHAAYERFASYVPCATGRPAYTSGPKIAHIGRVEWLTIDDAATATAALVHGEVHWLQAAYADQVPLLARNSAITTTVAEPAGSMGIMRFNHLHPPFNNPEIRRALLGAVSQADVMNAVAGTDRRYWRDRVGLFSPGTPFASDVGVEVLDGARDMGRVQQSLADAGYRGEPIVVLGVSGAGYIPALSQVGADILRQAGMTIDLKVTDYATMARRIQRRDAPEHGGWNVYFTPIEGAFNHTPATNNYIRGDGVSGAPGWPTSPRFEALRQAWIDADDIADQQRIAVDMQRQLWIDVPFIPLGQWFRVTAYRKTLTGMPWGFSAFYGVRREA